MTTTPRAFPASLDRVKDGDTFRLSVDLGDDLTAKWTVRLRGVDCPELKTPEGKLAAQATANLLSANPHNQTWPLTVITVQTADGSLEREKYGRYLANVVLPDGSILAEVLIAGAFAKPWDGQGPHPWLLIPPAVVMALDESTHVGADKGGAYVPKLFRD